MIYWIKMSDNQKWNSALIKTGPKSVTHIYYDLDQFWSWLGQGFFYQWANSSWNIWPFWLTTWTCCNTEKGEIDIKPWFGCRSSHGAQTPGTHARTEQEAGPGEERQNDPGE